MRYDSRMEADLQRKCLKEARRRGCLAFKIIAVSFVGFPDTMVIFPGGLIILVEFKQPGGKLRPVQVRRIKQLRSFGVKVYVEDDYDKFIGLLEFYRGADPRD